MIISGVLHDGKPFSFRRNSDRHSQYYCRLVIPVFGSGRRLEPATGIFVTRTFPKFSTHSIKPCISSPQSLLSSVLIITSSTLLSECWQVDFSCSLIGSACPTVIGWNPPRNPHLSLRLLITRPQRSRSPSRHPLPPSFVHQSNRSWRVQYRDVCVTISSQSQDGVAAGNCPSLSLSTHIFRIGWLTV